MCFKVLHAHSHCLLQGTRSRVGLMRGTANKLKVGFASRQPESSGHRKTSPKSLRIIKRSCKKVTSRKEKVCNFMFMAEFLPKCQKLCEHKQ